MTADLLLGVNALATWTMVGVIWFVHQVHYPLFDRYDRAEFTETETLHQSHTFGVVFPPMIVELVTTVLLVAVAPPGVPLWLRVLGGVLVLIWGTSTALVQIPCHEQLARGFDGAVHQRLVTTNRVRVAAWVGHGLVCASMVALRYRTLTAA